MRVISRRKLREFWETPGNEDAQQPLLTWYGLAKRATWSSFADVRSEMARSADAVGDRVVFDIGGNKYRLIVVVKYAIQTIYVRWVGSHSAYDRIDVTEV